MYSLLDIHTLTERSLLDNYKQKHTLCSSTKTYSVHFSVDGIMNRHAQICSAMANNIAESKAVYLYPRILYKKNSGGKLIDRYSLYTSPTMD